MADQSHSLIWCFETRLSVPCGLDSSDSKVEDIILAKGIRWSHFSQFLYISNMRYQMAENLENIRRWGDDAAH